MPYIWIKRFNTRKLREIERTVEHIVEQATKDFPQKSQNISPLDRPQYMDFKELEKMADKAKKDPLGCVSLREVEKPKPKFEVVNFNVGEDGVKAKVSRKTTEDFKTIWLQKED
jgi:hypothetical protein